MPVGTTVGWVIAFLQKYRAAVSKVFAPFQNPSGLFFLAGVDSHHRYQIVANRIVGETLLDIGAGGKSFFQLGWNGCVSLELHKLPGIDVVASATHLPFRNDSFDCVVCVDVIEHVPRGTRRDMALLEIKRVAKMRAIIHAPVEDGKTYRGRSYDLALNRWLARVKRKNDISLLQHIESIEPAKRELEAHGFSLEGSHNAKIWLSYMQLSHAFKWPVGVLVSQLYYMFKRKNDNMPPFWGAVGVFDKPPSNATI